MKLRKQITLTLLIFANIFLLAHTVLPHAHHDGIVCFSLVEQQDQCDCGENHGDVDSCCCGHDKHAHNHNHNAEDCDLKNIVLRHDNAVHDDFIPCDHCLSLLYNIYSLNDLFSVEPECGRQIEYKPYLITYIPPFVGTNSSLRAPPVSYFLG